MSATTNRPTDMPTGEQNPLHRAIELLQHSEAPFYEACRILRELKMEVCTHRIVTVTEDGGRCNRCGTDLSYDPITRNWIGEPAACITTPPADELAKAAGLASEETAQDIAPGHNPDRLSREQVGEGWRLLEEYEIVEGYGTPFLLQIQRWDDNEWEGTKWIGNEADATYRTRLNRAELRAARGLPPEPTPANPCWDEAEDRAWVHDYFNRNTVVTRQDMLDFYDAAIARERQRTQAPDEATVREWFEQSNGDLDLGRDAQSGCYMSRETHFNWIGFKQGVRATSGPKPEGRES